MKISKAMYEYALSRIEQLLPITPDCSPEDNPLMAELVIVSNIVEEYEKEYYPIGTPTVGEIIADAMEDAKMSGKELAQKLNVSPSRVSDYVNNRAEPTLKIARLLCKVLPIHPTELLY